MTIECPHCQTTYTHERCAVPELDKLAFTIKCLVCRQEFEGLVLHLPAQPPARLHTLTRGLVGFAGLPATFHALTRAR